jgi:trans-2,3-dihydro-3-hydroxyanthranilate isomerase
MGYRYTTCDVFTKTLFGGNQLAVLPQATGLSSEQMQHIAREFNFSETTFVFPAEKGHTRRVRIFTPTTEIPFAGHPNVGTAFILATAGEFGAIDGQLKVTFEEKAGLVPVMIQSQEDGRLWCELEAPQTISLGKTITPQALASAVSLREEDIITTTHQPQDASVRIPFLMAELKSLEVLARARARVDELEALAHQGISPDIHLYIHSKDEFNIRSRMFAPLDGVPEDPATGSANCALVGLLSHYNKATDGKFSWRIAQGVEMGRPSTLDARTEKKDGVVISTRIGGDCVLVSQGVIEVEPTLRNDR